MMTQKDFEAIAKAMASVETHSDDATRAWKHTVIAVSDVLSATNPRFDHGKFREAVGYAKRICLPGC